MNPKHPKPARVRPKVGLSKANTAAKLDISEGYVTAQATNDPTGKLATQATALKTARTNLVGLLGTQGQIAAQKDANDAAVVVAFAAHDQATMDYATAAADVAAGDASLLTTLGVAAAAKGVRGAHDSVGSPTLAVTAGVNDGEALLKCKAEPYAAAYVFQYKLEPSQPTDPWLPQAGPIMTKYPHTTVSGLPAGAERPGPRPRGGRPARPVEHRDGRARQVNRKPGPPQRATLAAGGLQACLMIAGWPPPDLLHRAAAAVAEADAIVVAAGAGMGVDSGLPDFRGDAGFWRAYPLYEKLGLDFASMANPRWFDRDPAFAWGFYGHRLELYRRTEPHPGFALLRAWAAQKKHGAFVFTSNVDGHFQRAGFGADRVVEIHGSIHFVQCLKGCPGVATGRSLPHRDRSRNPARPGSLPACERCRGMLRPNILMFGDGGWNEDRSAEQEARLGAWIEGLGAARVVVLECGAGTAIPRCGTSASGFSAGRPRWCGSTCGRRRCRPVGSASPWGRSKRCARWMHCWCGESPTPPRDAAPGIHGFFPGQTTPTPLSLPSPSSPLLSLLSAPLSLYLARCGTATPFSSATRIAVSYPASA